MLSSGRGCCPGGGGGGGCCPEVEVLSITGSGIITPPVDRQTGVKTLPFPKLRLRNGENTRYQKSGTDFSILRTTVFKQKHARLIYKHCE